MHSDLRRGGVVKGLFISFGILAACCLFLIMGAIFRVSQSVKVTESPSNGETRVETPFGSLKVRERTKLDPHTMGVPLYPGAERVEDSRKLASFELDFGDMHKDFALAVAEYVTSDPIQSVEKYYRDQLNGARVKHNRNQRVVIEVEGGTVRKMVALRERNGRTHISLASMTDAAAN